MARFIICSRLNELVLRDTRANIFSIIFRFIIFDRYTANRASRAFHYMPSNIPPRTIRSFPTSVEFRSIELNQIDVIHIMFNIEVAYVDIDIFLYTAPLMFYHVR